LRAWFSPRADAMPPSPRSSGGTAAAHAATMRACRADRTCDKHAMDENLAAITDNMSAVETALDALAALRVEFDQASASAHWFYDATCRLIYADFRIHHLLAGVGQADTPWRRRHAVRLLAAAVIESAHEIGATLTRSLESHLAQLTDNPRIAEPIDDLCK